MKRGDLYRVKKPSDYVGKLSPEKLEKLQDALCVALEIPDASWSIIRG